MAITFLLDTNVVSATRHTRVDPRVDSFLKLLNPSDLAISVMTLGELRKGLANKHRTSPSGAFALGRWMDEIEASFAGRILIIDLEIAKVWADLSLGRTRPVVDTLLAATAIVHNLTLVTRNIRDFEGLPVQLFNPWHA